MVSHKSLWLSREYGFSLHTSREYVAILCNGEQFNYWPISQIQDDPEVAVTIARNVRACCIEPERMRKLHDYEQAALDERGEYNEGMTK